MSGCIRRDEVGACRIREGADNAVREDGRVLGIESIDERLLFHTQFVHASTTSSSTAQAALIEPRRPARYPDSLRAESAAPRCDSSR